MNNQKHLTLSDRTYIEQELVQGSSFKSIAATLHKDPTTISKEVRKHRKLILAHDMRASLLWEYPCLNFKTLAFAAVR